MTIASSAVTKKPTRARKTIQETSSTLITQVSASQSTNLKTIFETFTLLLDKIEKAKDEFESLEKEIEEIKQKWEKEQKRHEQEVLEKRHQEEIERKRGEETYQYETLLSRKKAEDEFADKKEKWEKELLERKEEINRDKKELEELRRLVASFDSEKEKAVRQAILAQEQELTTKFDAERRLDVQESKAEKEILALKIESLNRENNRQAKEIEILRRSLEEASRQLKEIAVKVIESGRSDKLSPQQET